MSYSSFLSTTPTSSPIGTSASARANALRGEIEAEWARQDALVAAIGEVDMQLGALRRALRVGPVSGWTSVDAQSAGLVPVQYVDSSSSSDDGDAYSEISVTTTSGSEDGGDRVGGPGELDSTPPIRVDGYGGRPKSAGGSRSGGHKAASPQQWLGSAGPARAAAAERPASAPSSDQRR